MNDTTTSDKSETVPASFDQAYDEIQAEAQLHAALSDFLSKKFRALPGNVVNRSFLVIGITESDSDEDNVSIASAMIDPGMPDKGLSAMPADEILGHPMTRLGLNVAMHNTTRFIERLLCRAFTFISELQFTLHNLKDDDRNRFIEKLCLCNPACDDELEALVVAARSNAGDKRPDEYSL